MDKSTVSISTRQCPAAPLVGTPTEATAVADRLAAAHRLLQAQRPAEQASASRWTNWYNR